MATSTINQRHIFMATSTIQFDLIHAPMMHRNIYRGKYLGSSYTAAQKAAIQAGTFDDLYVGDYWTIGGVNWRIADFDYWYGTGDVECTTHHAVIVPDTNLYNAQMNTSNTTSGGYYGSAMRGGANGITSGNLSSAVTTINNAFGSGNVLSKRLHMTSAVTNGYPSNGTWYNSTVDLMNEMNVYGTSVFTPTSNGSTTPNLYTIDYCQFALFHLAKRFICNRGDWWLRDVASAIRFGLVSHDGNASMSSASNSCGVRPAFAVC